MGRITKIYKEVLRLRQENQALKDKLEKLEEALGVNSEWPVWDVLDQLVMATEHLLHDHNCDTKGHESYSWCMKVARTQKEAIKHALAETEICPRCGALAADIVARIPEMAKDSPINNQIVIQMLIEEELKWKDNETIEKERDEAIVRDRKARDED